MLVRVSRLSEGYTMGWQGIDLPSPTVTASGGETGSGRGAVMLQMLVEPWEDSDVVRIKAQAGGNITRIDDVTDRPMTSVCAFMPTDVYVVDEPSAAFSARAQGKPKPPYKVPPMSALRRKRRGPVVASTFSGAGGSSVGYKMAGFDVRCAVEIAPVPAASYRRNFPRATVLERSIRDVTAKEIMEACGVGPGELDVLDGSPPCTSFSTAGLRAKTWGKKRVHAGVEQRIDDLFFDYARLLEEIRPRTFVAENVAGLYRGAAIGYFKAILRVFRQCGYVVHVKLLDADLLGVPQHRERVIFVGVRGDVADSLDIDQAYVRERLFPKPLPYQYTVRDALPWLDPASDAYSLQGTPFGTPERIANGTATPPERVKPADVAPAATLLAGGHGRAGVQVAVVQDPRGIHPAHGDVTDTQAPTIRTTDQGQWKVVTTDDGGTVYRRKFSILEVKRLCSFPDDFELEGKFNEQWAQLGNSVPPVMMRAVAERLRDGVFKRLK